MDSIAGLVGALAAVALAIGAYVQFVLRKTIYPCLEVDLDFRAAGRRSATGELVGELVVLITNVGPGVGAVRSPMMKCSYARSTASGTYDVEPKLPDRIASVGDGDGGF